MSEEIEDLVGSELSLISKSQIRYSGILYSIDTEKSEITLRSVRVFGTEGREIEANLKFVGPTDKIYDFIVFNGQDICDLEIHNQNKASSVSEFNDPAVVSSSINPSTDMPHPVSTALPVPRAEKSKNFKEAVRKDDKASEKNAAVAVMPAAKFNEKALNSEDSKNKVVPGMGKHLLFKKFRGITNEGKRRIHEKLDQDFDFHTMNNKFSEIRLKTSDELENEIKAQSSQKSAGYRKSAFFDDISSDFKDRAAGVSTRLTHSEERKLNSETFGAIALESNYGHRRGSRGRGNYRGRSGGRGSGGVKSGKEPQSQIS